VRAKSQAFTRFYGIIPIFSEKHIDSGKKGGKIIDTVNPKKTRTERINAMTDFIEEFDEELETADDDIVTLTSADGEEIDFVEIAGIAHEGKFYAILQPVELIEGMEDDEALVFEVSRNENGEDNFSIVLDDDIINPVFEIYNKLLDEADDDSEEQ